MDESKQHRTEERNEEIATLADQGVGARRLAVQFGISRERIRQIIARQRARRPVEKWINEVRRDANDAH
ncbi:MAG: hypothetical protein WD556_07795 [Actinomycetota bacterium]